jgi:rhodanese-related sulfurtransferase
MLVNPSDLVARAKATITECSVGHAEDCLDSMTLIVDLRELAEFQRGHIPGALHLPRGLLEFEIHGFVDRHRRDVEIAHEDQPIVLYCGTGGRSALAARDLEDLGYRNVKSMAGGIVAWAQAGLPVEDSDT